MGDPLDRERAQATEESLPVHPDSVSGPASAGSETPAPGAACSTEPHSPGALTAEFGASPPGTSELLTERSATPRAEVDLNPSPAMIRSRPVPPALCDEVAGLGGGEPPLAGASSQAGVEMPVGPCAPAWPLPLGWTAAPGAPLAPPAPRPGMPVPPPWLSSEPEAPAIPVASVAEEETFSYEAGPNWMLALVGIVAALTSGYEALHLAASQGFAPAVLRGFSFLGYAVLAAGLFLFALDALRSGRRRDAPGGILFSVVAGLVTLVGVALLIASHDPGRRI